MALSADSLFIHPGIRVALVPLTELGKRRVERFGRLETVVTAETMLPLTFHKCCQIGELL